MRWRWALAMSVLVTLVLSGLSDASYGAPSGADKGIAQAAVLTLRDFPPGWAPKARGKKSSLSRSLVTRIPACRKLTPLFANAKTGTRAESGTQFTDGTLTLENDAVVYPSVARALQPFTAAKGTDLSNCVQQLFKQVLQSSLRSQGVSNVSVVVQPANAGVAAGDDQTAIAMTISLSARGLPVSFYLDIVIVRVGRALDTFTFENDSGPVNRTMPEVIGASVGRLRSALAGSASG